MIRPVTDDDIGLRVLREAPAETTETIDIVAIHGIGAHPDDTWCKNVGTAQNPQWVNWLSKEDMLPAIVPQARIMRYGYQSQWFGDNAIRQMVSTVADRLLHSLRRKTKAYRPLLFICHCFGGLVVLKALLEAYHHPNEWTGIYDSTIGILFFGTPFRGAEGMSQTEMLEAARQEYEDERIQAATLSVLQPGNEFLQDLLDQLLKVRKRSKKAPVACFFELHTSNVGMFVGDQDRVRFVVNEQSGCLDLTEAISKYSRSQTHFNMNKFGKPKEEDFLTVRELIQEMIINGPSLMRARSLSIHSTKPIVSFKFSERLLKQDLNGEDLYEIRCPQDGTWDRNTQTLSVGPNTLATFDVSKQEMIVKMIRLGFDREHNPVCLLASRLPPTDEVDEPDMNIVGSGTSPPRVPLRYKLVIAVVLLGITCAAILLLNPIEDALSHPDMPFGYELFLTFFSIALFFVVLTFPIGACTVLCYQSLEGADPSGIPLLTYPDVYDYTTEEDR